MLELKQIVKEYPAGGETVTALKGIDLTFRENEFVSILGPSGCGKTTMLNIIGGLDAYTTGDLIINGISTKKYKDRDWDAYRNYSIGFVFQTYNLIPHQTVLQNVELALTLSGVSKKERRERAKEALAKVGLLDQLKKRPSQMSGGQMQRVAIARAIVNNPDIILADEPTGALDTETSVQVMDILKEIAKDRLVIMVTHNPDLANRYSTRIVNMLDGRITGDSNPITHDELVAMTVPTNAKAPDSNSRKKQKKLKKPSMSIWTSFGLSLKNLLTKKGRTILTSFAGSIGIIGIALIYAVSEGTTMYIDTVQEETLSSYPLTLEASSVDMSSLFKTFLGKAESIEEHEKDAVYPKAMMYEMMNAINSLEEQKNDLTSFMQYIEEKRKDKEHPLHDAINAIKYTYNTDLLIYTENVDGNIIPSDSEVLSTRLIKEYMGADFSSMIAMRDSSMFGSGSQMMSSQTAVWQELLPGDNGRLISPLVEKQNDLIYGSWPTRYDEIVLFVDQNNELYDMALYALGLKSEEEIDALMRAAIDQEIIEYESKKWTYEEICNLDFRTILPSDCYAYDETTKTYSDLRETDTGLRYLYDNGLNLHVVGIARPKEDSVQKDVNGYIGYTSKLTEYIINKAHSASIVQDQQKTADIDVFNGLPFKPENNDMTEAEKAKEFKNYIKAMSDEQKADKYIAIMSIPDEDFVKTQVTQSMGMMTREQMIASMSESMSQNMNMDTAKINDYINSMTDAELSRLFSSAIEERIRSDYAARIDAEMSQIPKESLASMLDEAVKTYSDSDCASYYDTILDFSDSTYDDNLIKLGCVELDCPATMNLYATTFADKDIIEDAIAEYNEGVDDLQEIKYTDYVGMIMSSVTTIIDAITYVLIAFVAVSLIVSSIMIGVITLISVQERTKEIGILRAIGASKKNVSNMFNAETVIIGFTSGTLGVLITYLLTIPINAILHNLTGIHNLSAYLPPKVGLMLIIISMLLTLIAGIIPSRSAAKKDPVVALRTE